MNQLTKNERIILFSEIVDSVDINNANLLSNALFLVGVPIIDSKYFSNTGSSYLPKTNLIVNVYLNLYFDSVNSTGKIYQLSSIDSTPRSFPFGLIIDISTPPAINDFFINKKFTLPLFKNGQLFVTSENLVTDTFQLKATNPSTGLLNSIMITI